MQDDLADGARWAVAQGHADAQRICIAGASYGGYAVLMGLARDPDLYRCGISWVAVTDPELLFSAVWSDITEAVKTYGMNRMIGDPKGDAALFKAASALENAARIRQPLLLAYGAWDTRVPLVHGERFLAAVRPHNPGVEWVVYPNEGHSWARPETRIDFWRRVERFLAGQIGPNQVSR
jgi:dipeptidyl aminopeptidase/acylaminoacyl peptidase